MAGAVPEKGIVVSSASAACMKSIPHRCETAPRPALARLILSLLART